MTTKLNGNAWTYGVAVSEEAKKADDVVISLHENLHQATEMAGLAKSAFREVLQYRLTYERHIQKPETKGRRSVINKKANLGANYFGAAQAFAHYGKCVMECVKELEKLIPVLIKGGDYYNSTEESYGRKSNAVLASGLILSVPEELERLVNEFNMPNSFEHYIYVCTSNTALSELADRVCNHEHANRFDNTLKLPYIVGFSTHKSMCDLDKAVAELDDCVARGQKIVKEYSDSKARYFSDRFDGAQTWTANQHDTYEEFKGLQADYEIVNWAMENFSSELYRFIYNLEEAIKCVRPADMKYNPMVYVNLVAAKCKLVAAGETRIANARMVGRWARPCDQDEKTSKRRDLSRKVLEDAFTAIPAVHRLPSMSFLDNPTRR